MLHLTEYKKGHAPQKKQNISSLLQKDPLLHLIPLNSFERAETLVGLS